MEVSIIIPVYNAQKYLERCINSVLSQEGVEVELILIDDGSIDESTKICELYSSKYREIKFFRQKNKGVSAARNTGLMYASGQYIGFVDSDDYIDSRMYDKLLRGLVSNNADIAICDNRNVVLDMEKGIDTFESLTRDTVLDKKNITPDILLEIAGGVCRCLYRREVICNIKFPLDLKISEDRIFNLYAMGYAEKIVYLKDALYYRTLNEESAVHKYYKNYISIVERGRKETVNAIKIAWEDNQLIQEMYKRQYVDACLHAIENEKHKDSRHTYIQKYKTIKSIAQKEDLREAIYSTLYYEKNYRCKWILEKKYFVLSLSNQKIFRKIESVKYQINRDGIVKYIKIIVGKLGNKI